MIKLKSPYGRSGENLGDWACESSNWDVQVSSAVKDKLCEPLNEGEFFMSLADFVQTFTNIECVHLDTETSRDEPTLHGKGKNKNEFPIKLTQALRRKIKGSFMTRCKKQAKLSYNVFLEKNCIKMNNCFKP